MTAPLRHHPFREALKSAAAADADRAIRRAASAAIIASLLVIMVVLAVGAGHGGNVDDRGASVTLRAHATSQAVAQR